MNVMVNSIFEEVAFVLMYSHPQLLFSIVVVEVFSTDERLVLPMSPRVTTQRYWRPRSVKKS